MLVISGPHLQPPTYTAPGSTMSVVDCYYCADPCCHLIMLFAHARYVWDPYTYLPRTTCTDAFVPPQRGATQHGAAALLRGSGGTGVDGVRNVTRLRVARTLAGGLPAWTDGFAL